MDMSSTCACKERVEVARGQGGSVGSKATISLAVLALAQLGVSADNGAFSVAMSEMMRVFGCSVADVQRQTPCTHSWPAPSCWPAACSA